MKRICGKLFLVLVVLITGGGCASKQGAALEMTNEKSNCKELLAQNHLDTTLCEWVESHQMMFFSEINPSFGYMHFVHNRSSAMALQMAAQYTLKKGDNYFAVVYPKMLSNFEGSTLHKAEEFFDKCDISIVNFLMLNTDPCELRASKALGQIGVVTFKDKPKEPVTYGANEVLLQLKSKNRESKELKFTRFGILAGK